MSKTMNFFVSLILLAAGVAIFIFCPIFKLKAGNVSLESPVLLDTYKNIFENIESIIELKPSAEFYIAVIGLPLSILTIGGKFKGVLSGVLGIISLFLFKENVSGLLFKYNNFGPWGIILFVIFGLSILFSIMTIAHKK